MIRLLIFGPTGSIGRLISKLALEDSEIEVIAACDISEIYVPLEQIVGTKDPNGIVINHVKNLEELIKRSNPTIAVDFTTPEATEKNSITCIENNVRIVIGTTGLSDIFLQGILLLVEKKGIPILIIEEQIEIKHQASNQESLACKVIQAIKLISKAKESKIYSMSDIS